MEGKRDTTSFVCSFFFSFLFASLSISSPLLKFVANLSAHSARNRKCGAREYGAQTAAAAHIMGTSLAGGVCVGGWRACILHGQVSSRQQQLSPLVI